MKKIVAVLLLALLVTCCVLPVTTQAVTVRREFAEIINVDHWCNMRARPTVESEIVARVNRGDRVMLLCWNEDETWCFVDYNGKLGWINVKFLKSEGLKEVEVTGAALPKPEPIEKPDDKETGEDGGGDGEDGDGNGEDGGEIDLGGGDWTPPKL